MNRKRRALVSDLLLLSGLGLMAAGAWMLHPGAGCVVAGVAAIVVSALVGFADRGGDG